MTISEADILRYHYSHLNTLPSSSTVAASSSSSSDRRCSNCSHPIDTPPDPTAFTGNTSGIDVVPVAKGGKSKKRKAVVVSEAPKLPGGTQAVAELRRTAEVLGRLAKEVVDPRPGASGSGRGVEQKTKKRKKADVPKISDAFGIHEQATTERAPIGGIAEHSKIKKKVGRPKGSGRKSDPFGNGLGHESSESGLDLTALAQRVLSDGNASQTMRNTVNSPTLCTINPSTIQSSPYQHSIPHHITPNRLDTYMLDPDVMTDPAMEIDELSTPSQPMLARQVPRMGVPVYHQNGIGKGGEAAKSRVDVLAGRGKKARTTGWAVGTPGRHA